LEQNLVANRLAALGGGASVGSGLINAILNTYGTLGGLAEGAYGNVSRLATQPGFGTNLLTSMGAIGSGLGSALSGLGVARLGGII